MKVSGGIWVGAAAFAMISGQAMAQLPATPAYVATPYGPSVLGGPEAASVADRPRPDFDPLGIRGGSFIFHPTLGVSGTYDTNIFATATRDKSDIYATETPALGVQSDWNRHALAFNASGQFKQYRTFDSENVNNGATDLRGRFDIANAQYFVADAGYVLQHEDRAAPDAPANAKNPVEYHVAGLYLGYVKEDTRIGFRVDAAATSYDYNNQSTGTGALVEEQDRDHIEYIIAPRVSYEFMPGYQAFVRAVGNVRQYNAKDFTTFQALGQSARRNSKGWEFDVGTAINITRLITAQVYVGYLHQEYESPLFSNVWSPAFGGNVVWNVTPLTSIRGSASESVVETVLAGSSSYVESALSAGVEHELLRNVLLLGTVSYLRDDYKGISRTDDTYGADIGARYLLNRNVRLTADLAYTTRSSSTPGAGFDRGVGTVGVQVGF